MSKVQSQQTKSATTAGSANLRRIRRRRRRGLITGTISPQSAGNTAPRTTFF